jgi:hypothetical protein
MGPAASKWCPECGAEYLPQMRTCSDCLVALVDEPPPEPDHELREIPPEPAPFEGAEDPDWFVLPDGRRFKELPVGPDVATNAPVEWSYNSWTFRWFLTLFRDVVRRMTERP